MATWTSHLGTGTPPGIAVRHDTARVGIDGLPVPRLRGRLHQGAVVPTAVLGVTAMLVSDGLVARTAMGVFTFSIVAMLTASAVYHCHCSTHEMRVAARRVDHATILVAIAGTQTAFWLLVGPEAYAPFFVPAVWIVTAVGFFYKVRRLEETKNNGSWLFFVLGWSGTLLIPYLLSAGLMEAGLVVAGGAAYSVGGVLLFRKAGNIWPGVAGYHEVWHALTIVGFVCHGIAIAMLTGAA